MVSIAPGGDERWEGFKEMMSSGSSIVKLFVPCAVFMTSPYSGSLRRDKTVTGLEVHNHYTWVPARCLKTMVLAAFSHPRISAPNKLPLTDSDENRNHSLPESIDDSDQTGSEPS
jgi:hypothetical protein